MNGPLALFHVTVEAHSMSRDTEERVLVFKLETPTGPEKETGGPDCPVLWEKQSASFAPLECLEGVGDSGGTEEERQREQIAEAKRRIPDHIPNEEIVEIEEIPR